MSFELVLNGSLQAGRVMMNVEEDVKRHQ